MSIFDKLGSGGSNSKIIEPARLFRSLPDRDERFVAPRDYQTEVWNAWFNRREENDLILKMNTGSGKTVVGLLILKSSLNEAVGPAVYLVPDKNLQRQVLDTANLLGIESTSDSDDPDFRRGRSILVVPVAKLVNGMSKFGVRGGPPARRIPIGALVIDDAHASIPLIEGQYSLSIPRTTAPECTYEKLLALFSDDLKQQSLSGWNELNEQFGSTVLTLPYWAWQEKLERATHILASEASDDQNKWKWPLVKDQLALADVAFTPSEVQVGLAAPYLDAIPAFGQAARRVYMTATLADDAIMMSKLGASSNSVVNPITPRLASDMGDRIILTPVETSRAIKPADVHKLVSDLAKTVNSVVIVPSSYRAEPWRAFTSEVHDARTIGECVQRLKSGFVGLVVFIAKYDGVDLPGSACRVLVLDGLPERYSPLERAEATILGDTNAMRTNQVQRIEQGMGRGVRSATDYCAVILLDPRLVQRLDFAADRALLSPGTRAQLQLSQQFADSALRGKPLPAFREAIDSFLSRDNAWTGAAKDAIDDLEFPPVEQIPGTTSASRTAWEDATYGRYQRAFDTLAGVFGDSNDALEDGWIKQRAAAYINHLNPIRAKEIQHLALRANNFVSRQSEVVTTPRIKLAMLQAEQSAARIALILEREDNFLVSVEAILANLVPTPVPGSHKAFEAAFDEAGLLLGFSSTRPDHQDRLGPDNLWAIGNDSYWVIECKSEAVANKVSRSDLGQLSHSIDWFEREYSDPRFQALPVLIHPSSTPNWDAVPRQGTRFMTFDLLETFREAIRQWATALAVDTGYRDSRAISSALAHYSLVGTQMRDKWTRDSTTARQ
jgi:hypothetical protein